MTFEQATFLSVPIAPFSPLYARFLAACSTAAVAHGPGDLLRNRHCFLHADKSIDGTQHRLRKRLPPIGTPFFAPQSPDHHHLATNSTHSSTLISLDSKLQQKQLASTLVAAPHSGPRCLASSLSLIWQLP